MAAELDDDAIRVPHQPDRLLPGRRPARRLRPDRAQDHRRHLRRPGPARRRRLQRQGPDQGRPLRRLHGPLHRQEHRRGRPGRRQCEVQLSYAIGYPDPLNIWVNTNGTLSNGLTEEQLVDLIRKHFKLTPKGIIETLNLRRPIYRKRPATAISAASCRASPGRRPTRPPPWPRKSACMRWRRSRARIT